MKDNQRKWQKTRSSLRDRLDQRTAHREQPYYSSFSQDFRMSRFDSLPAALTKQLRDNMFHKTAAAIIVVICLGVFGLFNTSLTNRIVELAHALTTTQMEPATWLEKAKPVIQTIRDFSWREDSQPPPLDNEVETPANASEEMVAPVNGVLSSPFGTRLVPGGNGLEMHYGIDVTAEAGSSVYAAFSGTVSLVKEHEVYGTTIYIQHPNDLVTIYGRVAGAVVAAGDVVKRGDEIAKVASATEGDSHLHFEIWEEKQPVDPETFLTETTTATEIVPKTDTEIN